MREKTDVGTLSFIEQNSLFEVRKTSRAVSLTRLSDRRPIVIYGAFDTDEPRTEQSLECVLRRKIFVLKSQVDETSDLNQSNWLTRPRKSVGKYSFKLQLFFGSRTRQQETSSFPHLRSKSTTRWVKLQWRRALKTMPSTITRLSSNHRSNH